MSIKSRFSMIFLSLIGLFILMTSACDRVSPFQNRIRGGLGVSGKPVIVNRPAYASLTDRRVVFNDNGVGLAVVSKNSGGTFYTSYSLYYSVFNPSSGAWSDEVLLHVVGSYSNFSLATDGENFMLVFLYNNGLFSRTYSNGSWSAADTLPLVNVSYFDDLMLFGSPTGYLAVYRDTSYSYYYASVYENSAWGQSTQLAYSLWVFPESVIASNGAGGYCVAWIYYDGDYTVNAAVYDPVTEWGTLPVTPAVLSDSLTSCLGLGLVSAGAGYCASWEEYSSTGTDNDVMASVYDDGAAIWTAKALIDNTDSGWNANASSPVLVTNGSSYGVAWIQNDGVNNRVAARGCSGTTWDSVCDVLSDAGAPAWNVRGASNGDTYAVGYIQYDSTLNLDKPFVRMLDPGSGLGWGAARRISNDSLGNDSYLALRSDGSGYLAAWRQQEAAGDRLYASEFGASAWGTPVTADAGAYPAEIPKLRPFDGGYYFQWTEDNEKGNTCWVNTLLPSGWTGARDVASDNSALGTCMINEPWTAATGSGAVMAVYMQYNGGETILYGRIYNGSWADPFVIAAGNNLQYYAVASNGTGFMVAYSDYGLDGSYHLYTFSYTTAGVSADTGEIVLPNLTNPPGPINMASNGTGYCVIWRQYDGANNGTFASVYNGTSWDPYTTIMAAPAGLTKLVSNGTGYCVVLTLYTGEAYAGVYEAPAWGAVSRIDILSNMVSDLNIASNGSTYCAVWTQLNGSYTYCYANRYEGGAWQGQEQISNLNAYAYGVSMAVSGLNYFVAWAQSTGGQYRIYSSMFDDASGFWGGKVILDDPFMAMNSYYSYPVAASAGEDLAVLWIIDDNSMDFNRIAAVTYEGGLWGELSFINSEVSALNSYSLMARPGNTGYFIAWKSYYDGADSLFGAYYDGQWSGEILLENEPGYIEYPYTRIVPSGNGYNIFWYQRDMDNSSVFNVWTNRIVP